MRGRDVAEVLAEADVIVLRDRLVTEEQDLPLHQRGAQRLDGADLEWLAEIDAIDIGANDARRRLDRDSRGDRWIGGHACVSGGRRWLGDRR